VQASPNPSSSFNYLNSVAATSASNAWAVGYYYNGPTTLVEHWCRRLSHQHLAPAAQLNRGRGGRLRLTSPRAMRRPARGPTRRAAKG
jgi:hypothetical protein